MASAIPSVSWCVSPELVSWTTTARNWLSSRRAYAIHRESGDHTGFIDRSGWAKRSVST